MSSVSYASFSKRLLANFIDMIFGMIIVYFVTVFMGGDFFSVFKVETLEQFNELQTNSGEESKITLAASAVMALWVLSMWLFSDGATPGKKLLGIKIVKTDGSRISVLPAVLRYFGYFVSILPFFLGYFWVLWDKKRQGWHDKIAGTVVVQTGTKPNMALALLLGFLGLSMYLVYCGGVFVTGFKLGFEDALHKNSPSVTLEQSMESISPEAKVHYDTSQELFVKMRGVINEPEAIRPLADKAIIEARLATDLQPGNALLWVNLGDALSWPNTLGTAEEGLAAYKKAEELEPENVVYINFVGDQLNRMGKYEDAILQFQKTLRKTNSSGYANISIARSYKALGIRDKAREHFGIGISIFETANKDGRYDKEILNAQKELANL